MIKQHKLTGTITLPIEIIVECDSTKIAPSSVGEHLLLSKSNDFLIDGKNVVRDSQGFVAIHIDTNIIESGAIEFNDITVLENTFIIVCPHCGVSLQNSGELGDSDDDMWCESCNNAYAYEREVTVTYTSWKVKNVT